MYDGNVDSWTYERTVVGQRDEYCESRKLRKHASIQSGLRAQHCLAVGFLESHVHSAARSRTTTVLGSTKGRDNGDREHGKKRAGHEE